MKPRTWTLLTTLAVLFCPGCSKVENPSTPPASTNSGPTAPDSIIPTPSNTTNVGKTTLPTQPSANQGKDSTPDSRPSPGAVHPFMTQQLHYFITEHGRLPQDFAELVQDRMEGLSPSAVGMKYVIDTGTHQVKVVQQRAEIGGE